MIINCAPPGYFKEQMPSLKKIWKWLKCIMNEYIILKTKIISNQKENDIYKRLIDIVKIKLNLNATLDIY